MIISVYTHHSISTWTPVCARSTSLLLLLLLAGGDGIDSREAAETPFLHSILLVTLKKKKCTAAVWAAQQCYQLASMQHPISSFFPPHPIRSMQSMQRMQSMKKSLELGWTHRAVLPTILQLQSDRLVFDNIYCIFCNTIVVMQNWM